MLRHLPPVEPAQHVLAPTAVCSVSHALCPSEHLMPSAAEKLAWRKRRRLDFGFAYVFIALAPIHMNHFSISQAVGTL